MLFVVTDDKGHVGCCLLCQIIKARKNGCCLFCQIMKARVNLCLFYQIVKAKVTVVCSDR